MIESLIPWYERELHSLWKGSKLFSKKHPQLARFFAFSHGHIDDPHAERVLEAFAFLNARLSHKLSSESNNTTKTLLQILFPTSMQSLPSVSILRIPPSIEQTSFKSIPKNTRFLIHTDNNKLCQYRTTREIDVCPFDVVSSHIKHRPFNHNDIHCDSSSKTLLKLNLAMLDDSLTFKESGSFSDLTFQLSGLLRLQTQLYDMMNKDLCSISLITPDGQYFTIPIDNFNPIGFDDDCIIDNTKSHLVNHQKMLEIFSWPELYFGFKLKDIGQLLIQCQCSEATIVFGLSSYCDEVSQNIGFIHFLLGCAPIINLFEHIAEPIVIDHKQLDYPIIPDISNENILNIQEVTKIIDITKTQPELLPNLFGLHHNDKEGSRSWLYRSPDDECDEYGHLELVCTDLDPYQNQTMVLSPHLLCNNGSQVTDIPDNPSLECIDPITLPEPHNIHLLMRPTATVQRSANTKAWINLLTYLHNNIVSVLESNDPAKQLRQIMSLYTTRDHTASNAWLSSILSMKVIPQASTLQINGRRCFSQGSEIIFELDPTQLENTSIMMFTHLLDYMAANFVGLHSFIQVVIKLKGSQEEYIRCTRHHGYQVNR